MKITILNPLFIKSDGWIIQSKYTDWRNVYVVNELVRYFLTNICFYSFSGTAKTEVKVKLFS